MTRADVLRDPHNGTVYVRLYDARDTATSGDYPYMDIAMERVAWDPDIMRRLAIEAITHAGIEVPKNVGVPPRCVLKLWTARPLRGVA